MADFQTPDDEAIQPFTTPDDEAVPQQSMAESAARGALRNVPMAQQAAAMSAPVLNKVGLSDKPDYSSELAHLTEAAEQGKEQNPASYYTGAAAGTVAPLMIPGAGEALAAAPILGNAALGATQSVSDTNLVKNPGQAAGEAAIGGGTGAIMGSLGKYFAGKAAPTATAATESAAPEVAEAAAPAEQLTQGAPVAPAAIGQHAIPPGRPVADDFVPSAERASAHMTAEGIGGTPRQFIKVMGKDPVKTLNDIREWMSTADNGKSVVGLMDRPGELLEKVQAIHDKAGDAIGKIVDKVGAKVSVSPRTLLGQLSDLAADLRYGDPAGVQKVTNIMEDLTDANKNGALDLAKLQQIKGRIGKFASKDPALAQAYGHFAEYMNDVVDRYSMQLGDPAMQAKYAATKLKTWLAARQGTSPYEDSWEAWWT
jgi:hypothetical protein